MAAKPTLPAIRQDLTENNKATGPFYVWFGHIQKALEAGTLSDDEAAAAIAAIATALGSPDGTVANIPPLNFLPKTTYVHAGDGIAVSGSLAGGGVDVALEALANSGLGALLAITRDAYGRVSGTRPAVLDDLDDVDAATPGVGDALVWSGAEWVPGVQATGGGCCEILVADGVSGPPVMLTNEAEDDFLYSD